MVALELAFYVAVVLIMDLNLSKYTPVLGYQKISVDKQLLLGYIWRGLYFMLFSTGYYFLKKYIKERNEKENINRYRLEELIASEKTEKELALAKNAFLLAQVNPHFLFNTLNFIYYKTYKGSPEGAKAIMRLSKIMYYATKALASSEQVIISEEVEHIENIIAINKMRHGEKLILDLQYDSDILNLKIIPLVLITIVENIFKHGYLTQSEFRAYFSITSDDENLIVSSGNLSKNSKNLTGLNSGLKNMKERMKYTYGAEAKIKYSENAQNYFTLELHIPLILCN
ncbi:MAG: hypothetical protein EOO20_09950 [Chryseobacterium sp.]|nr:MAG: hypothetical protein EOO20_09950 [Chryseobacterium sp.]